MTGTLINAAAVLAGGAIGLLIKNRLPERYSTVYFRAVGLFTLVLGIQMALKITAPLFVVFALVAGGLTGEWLRLEDRMTRLGDLLKTRLSVGNQHFTEGLVTAFLLFSMGSMSILGAIEEGLTGNVSDLLMVKSLMDGVSALLLASAMGVGVLFSAIPLLLYQGGITLLAMLAGSHIPDSYIVEITAVGGILLIGLAIDLLGIKRLQILNLLPALGYICLFLWVRGLW
jgi:uncharacterized membrane protein YqgA involved in biofilm formation